jgi:hypothetical protein
LDSIRSRPVLIYDDKCSPCTIFAKYAFKCSRGQIDCIGHFSEEGQKFRKFIFPPNYNETEMFWIITAKHAFGGRSGLLPLLGFIIRGVVTSVVNPELSPNRIFPGYCLDSGRCNNKKFKIKRLFNLLRNGKKLNIRSLKSVKG